MSAIGLLPRKVFGQAAAASSDEEYAVVDLFAGPGGLAEGFSKVTTASGRRPFRILVSAEKEVAAHQTLLRRSFLRQFEDGLPDDYYDYLNRGREEPDWALLYPEEWKAAKGEALRLELGTPAARKILDPILQSLRDRFGSRIVLIGGPPCQAYSIVGRVRNRGVAGYIPEDDPKHFLYKEYIRVLEQLEPAAFVMENVKGLLSSSVGGHLIVERVLRDLGNAGSRGGYRLIALAPQEHEPYRTHGLAADFVVRAEEHGVPQARHRVIVVGLRADLFPDLHGPRCFGRSLLGGDRVTVRHVLADMPRLRSGLSRDDDSHEAWATAVEGAAEAVLSASAGWPLPFGRSRFQRRLRECAEEARRTTLGRNGTAKPAISSECPRVLRKWLLDPKLRQLHNNETRSHMEPDLARYLFAAVCAETSGASPKSEAFPVGLAPAHLNWGAGVFRDRFRVQVWDAPATTVTSHISKDGHYFIHPDPTQCRSLTVREAARLQTFPDNYIFSGNRTQQFVQVGNAVPPFLAWQIGQALYRILTRRVHPRSIHDEGDFRLSPPS